MDGLISVCKEFFLEHSNRCVAFNLKFLLGIFRSKEEFQKYCGFSLVFRYPIEIKCKYLAENLVTFEN